MLHTVLTRGLAASIAAGIAILAFAAPAFAQRSVPVTVGNDEASPVPVYQAGRMPYQFDFRLSVSSTGVEDCEVIPVPDGMTLTVTSVGVDATIHQSDTPDVYILTSRSHAGGSSSFRFRGELEYTSSFSMLRYYKGIYNTTLHLGSATDPVTYHGSICVGSPPDGSNSARGILSGYVEPMTIIDGNSLP